MSIFCDGLMRGKVVLVTGGGTGIGRGIAQRFGELGASVVIASRKEPVLAEACEAMQALGIDCAYCVCDIRQAESVEQLLVFVLGRWQQLDIVVNNAAGNFPASIEQLSPNGFKTVVDIDLNGTFNVSKIAFERALRERGGSIVNITAPFAGWGVAFQAHCAAAKAGIDSLTRTAAVEWAPFGVRVNAVAPGSVANTEGLQRLSEALAGEAPDQASCTAEDIANTVVFLSSDGAQFISGEIIRVDSATGVDMLKLPVS